MSEIRYRPYRVFRRLAKRREDMQNTEGANQATIHDAVEMPRP
jgi:hypothetical protein